MADHAHIFVANFGEPGSAAVKPTGRCTMGMCATLRDHVRGVSVGENSDIYFDLSETEYMDSTFTGFLLALARRKLGDAPPVLHLVQPSEKALEVLETMGVLSLFDIRPAMPNAPIEWTELPVSGPLADEVGDLVIDAHEELIDADPANAAKFGPVVDAFRSERDRRRAADAEH